MEFLHTYPILAARLQESLSFRGQYGISQVCAEGHSSLDLARNNAR